MIPPYREVRQRRTYETSFGFKSKEIENYTPEYLCSLSPKEREVLLKNALEKFHITINDDFKTAEQFIDYGSYTMKLTDVVQEIALKKWVREYRDLEDNTASRIRQWVRMGCLENLFIGASDYDIEELTDSQILKKFWYMVQDAEASVVEEWRPYCPITWPWM